ncbi:alpha/beta fold hydrolase [Nesterenkonia natronophila]|uniref:alpha/beta fold hydrolase n=1 Tax=Nesterenkonia natronophila TaxID=2174932 RepID=UPI0011C44A9D|nr:alpha/beta hydrolase [Nesterenkonia natronophila]
MPRTPQHDTGFQTQRLYVGAHAVDVRGSFDLQRPAVVLVHGIGMSGEYFLPYADVLAATYDVYALDLPGYGSTPNPPRALTVAELGEVVAEVCAQLGLKAPVLIGHSMGCQIVTNTVANNPSLGAGYVLIGPTVDPAARSLPAQAWRLFRDTLAEPFATNAVVFRNYLRMGPLRYLRTLRYMFADRPEETIRQCRLPGLVVRGARDPIASAAWVRQLVRLAPDASLREVPEGPHALQHNQSQALAEACAPFIAARTGPGAVPRATSRDS